MCEVLSHLMGGAILLATASGRLLVVLADVHHLVLGALPDQVSAHARNIFKAMTWSNGNKHAANYSSMQHNSIRSLVCMAHFVSLAQSWHTLTFHPFKSQPI